MTPSPTAAVCFDKLTEISAYGHHRNTSILSLTRRNTMFTFRTSITFAVMAFVVALTALLIAIQSRSLNWATQEAASA